MRLRLCLLLGLAGIVAGVFSGCKKHPETGSTAPVTDTSQVSAPATTTPAQVQAPAPVGTPAAAPPANAAPDLARLSRQLRGWIVGHRRVPQNFEEFAATLNPPPPPAPAGKKYAIEKSTVILVDR